MKEKIEESLQFLRKSFRHKQVSGADIDSPLAIAHANIVLEGLNQYDLDLFNRSRFGLEDLAEIDSELVFLLLITMVKNLADSRFERGFNEIDQMSQVQVPSPTDVEANIKGILNTFQNLKLDEDRHFSILDYENFELNWNEQELRETFSMLIIFFNQLVVQGKQRFEEGYDGVLMLVAVTLRILKELGPLDLIFFVTTMVGDVINKDGNFQLARDFAENFVHLAIKESKHIELSNFVWAMVSVRQNNNIRGLIHLAAFYKGLEKGKKIDKNFARRAIHDTIKIFRNIKIYPIAIELSQKAINLNLLNGWDLHELHHILFTSRLPFHDGKIVADLLKYLDKERESIIQYGEHAAIGWYNTLKQVESIYGVDAQELQPYINQFGIMLSKGDREVVDELYAENPGDLMERIRSEILRIGETRCRTDFTSDIYILNYLASRAILAGYKENNIDLFSLGLILASDFRLAHEEPEQFSKMYIFSEKRESSSQLLDVVERTTNLIKSEKVENFHLLGRHNSDVFCYSLFGKESSCTKFEGCASSYARFFERYRDHLLFEEVVKVGNQFLPIEKWQYEEDLVKFKSDLIFSKIPAMENKSCLISKDIDLSRFPHNFFCNVDGELVLSTNGISNVLSPSLMTKRGWEKNCKTSFEKMSFWSPIVDGDMTLNRVYSELNVDEKFDSIDKELMPTSPIAGDINVVVAHGATDIGSTGLFFTGQSAVTGLERLFGKGKIAILFVCHSGAEKSSFFEHSVDSLARELIYTGYEVVIAPFWSLHISIPPIWYPTFIDNLMKGRTALEAFHKGALKVKEVNPHPGAWLCLHYYGNPNLMKS